MIHPDQEPDYQSKLEQAARNWLWNNSSSKKTIKEVADEIRENNLKVRQTVPCTEFDYSGTIWCDRCGWEGSSHPAKLPQEKVKEQEELQEQKQEIKRGQFRAKQRFISVFATKMKT